MDIKLKNEDIFPVLIEFGVDSTVTIDLLRAIRRYIEDYINQQQHTQQQRSLQEIFHTLIKKHGVMLSPEEEHAFQKKLIAIGRRCAQKQAESLFSDAIANIEAPPADDTTQVIQTLPDAEFQSRIATLKTDDERVQIILQKLGYSRFSEYDMKVFMMYIHMFIEAANRYPENQLIRIRQKTIATLRRKIGQSFLTGREDIFFEYLKQYVQSQ